MNHKKEFWRVVAVLAAYFALVGSLFLILGCSTHVGREVAKQERVAASRVEWLRQWEDEDLFPLANALEEVEVYLAGQASIYPADAVDHLLAAPYYQAELEALGIPVSAATAEVCRIIHVANVAYYKSQTE